MLGFLVVEEDRVVLGKSENPPACGAPPAGDADGCGDDMLE
jgi:hypothetical protein